MIDIVVPALLEGYPTVTATGAAVDEANADSLDAFTGTELAWLLWGMSGSISQITARCLPQASPCRGALGVNTAGRMGVHLGHHCTIEPIGRTWAITTEPGRWRSWWLPADLVRTMQ